MTTSPSRLADEPMLEGVPDEQIFVITFGVQYRTVPHPQGMTPDGYYVIVSPDEWGARKKAHDLFGDKWAFLYDHLDRERNRFTEENYPAGILGVSTLT